MISEESDLVDYSTDMKCFLCNEVFTETEEPWYIFHKQIRADQYVEFSIAAKLSEILEQEVKEETAHSQFLCEICNSNLLEYDSIERRLQSLRQSIQKTYELTLASNQIAKICDDSSQYLEFNDEFVIENNYECLSNSTNSQQMIQLSDIIDEDISSDKDLQVEPISTDIEEEEHLEVIVSDNHNETELKEKVVQNGEGEAQDNLTNLYCEEEISNENHESSLGTEYLESFGDINAHMQWHSTNENSSKSKKSPSYECQECAINFINYREFCLHRRLMHNNSNYECIKCNKVFLSQNTLKKHILTHSDEISHKCEKCLKDFSSKYALQAHVKIHTERTRAYKCNECEKTFYNRKNLMLHKKLHVGIKAFKCGECDKTFKVQSSLDVHMKIHSGWRPFQCHICGKNFARSTEVRNHERTHTGEKPFKCDLCPLAFAQRSNLTSHKKYTHFKEALHKCMQCDRSFKRRRLLVYHVQAIHTGERPHKCAICGLGFVYPEHFKKHMRKHTGQTPYACEVCGKQFKSSDNRNIHRFVHSEKKPYECLKCGAGFMRKPQLLIHMSSSGHTADTIIVNQPQIKFSNENDVNLAEEEDPLNQEQTNAIVVNENILSNICKSEI